MSYALLAQHSLLGVCKSIQATQVISKNFFGKHYADMEYKR